MTNRYRNTQEQKKKIKMSSVSRGQHRYGEQSTERNIRNHPGKKKTETKQKLGCISQLITGLQSTSCLPSRIPASFQEHGMTD